MLVYHDNQLRKIDLEVDGWCSNSVRRHGPRYVPELKPMNDATCATNKSAEGYVRRAHVDSTTNLEIQALDILNRGDITLAAEWI